jgi:ATP-dependent DNA helicase RecG
VSERVRKALLPPLRFAARNDFAALERLRNLGSLIERVRRDDDVSPALAALLDEAKVDFDSGDPGTRRRIVLGLIDALAPTDEAAPAAGRAASPATKPADPSGPATKPQASSALALPGTEAVVEEEEARRRPKRAPAVNVGPLARPVSRLKGVGPRRAEVLEKREVRTIAELLAILPRVYEDRRAPPAIANLTPGQVAVVVGEVRAAVQMGRGRGGRFEVQIDDATGVLRLVFFRFQAWDMKRRFAVGKRVTATGEVARYGANLQMVHPAIQAGDQRESSSGVVPIYPEVGGLHPLELARYQRAAVAHIRANPPPDPLPPDVRAAAGIIGNLEAMLAIHDPPGDADVLEMNGRTHPAFRRLAFEELFVMQIAVADRRRSGHRERAVGMNPDDELDVSARFEAFLPFPPTGAQVRVAEEITEDLRKASPMSRLLQGDVGAGKTAVAALACVHAVRAGQQVAFMAPTEILAEQHRATLSKLLAPLGIRVGYFSGALKTKERALRAARLANHEVDVAVGTHALLSDDVQFARLGLCVIDEQHRFGVVQRAKLKDGGEPDAEGARTPHLLVMTATPIPRSLALTYYGDLDVSVLDEMPPGRAPIETRVISEDNQAAVVDAVEAAIARGERAYVVYPLIEESEKIDLKDATNGAERFAERFGEDKVALLHGKLSSEDRDERMAAFVRGDVEILVATTVIEVGVDVPAATLMVVMHAERFGLSQLHQLRGRVGRGERQGRCLLVVSGGGRDAMRRLKVMEETTDGFRIAEEDLAIRGPGDFLGTRQHGLPSLVFSDLKTHGRMIETARGLAEKLLDEDPGLRSQPALKELVESRFAARLELARAG